MKIEVRPPEGMIVICELGKEVNMYHIYCDDGLENGINIILTVEQAKDLKEQLNKRDELK